jgi:small subunit ribosomal protein S1
MWFKEYNNFTLIKGEIVSPLINGFGVELNPCYINEFISEQNYEGLKKNELIEDNLFGFINKKAFKKNSDSNVYYTHLKKNQGKGGYKKSEISSVSEINLFLISSLNYSSSNKGSLINLIPYSESIHNLLSTYKIKSFFSCIDLYLINEAFNLLNVLSPFDNRHYTPLLPPTLSTQVKLDFNEDEFWDILKECRPKIFNETYVKTKENERHFKELIKIYNENKIIKGNILSRTQGGFFVSIEGHKAFLPGSQIEHYSIPDYESYIDKTMDFKIIKIDHQYKSAIISHSIIYEEQIENQKSTLISGLKKGLILPGIVKNITSYGVFIDLGGIDGLIHLRDLSWSRINHPNEIVELDQKLNIIILDFDESKSRIELGLKQLSHHPWESLDKKLKVGDIVNGEVTLIVDYGAFIEIEKGVEGLIHITEMSWSKNLSSVNEIVRLKDNIVAQVLTLDRINHKMSLGIKQLKPDPWKDIDSKIFRGKVCKGKVTKLIPLGVFVEIMPNIEGFSYKSDMPDKLYSSLELGNEILTKVISINYSEKKIKLILDFITSTSFQSKQNKYLTGSIHTAKVIHYIKNGVLVKSSDNKNGIININNFSWTVKYFNPSEFCSIGTIIKVKLIHIKKYNRYEFGFKQMNEPPTF